MIAPRGCRYLLNDNDDGDDDGGGSDDDDCRDVPKSSYILNY